MKARDYESLLARNEDRIDALETVVWGIPGLAVAGQAFLLSIVLDPATTDWARLLTGAIALAVAAATYVLFVRTLDYVNLHVAIAARCRDELGLPSVKAKDLRKVVRVRPAPWPQRLFARPSVRAWAAVVVLLLLVDCLILVLIIVDLAGGRTPLW